MKIFQKYAPSFAAICRDDSNNEAITEYIYNSSLNSCSEKIREHSSTIIKTSTLQHDRISSPELRNLLLAILDRRTSLAMMTMSRLEPTHCIKNENFAIALKRKLRLPIVENCHHYICTCKRQIDPYMDHSLGCRQCSKTAASNGIRDALIKILQRIAPIAKLIKYPSQLKKVIHNIVKSLPSLKPFDLSIRLDHLLINGSWKIPFARLGFDITLIHSTAPSSSTPEETAVYNETDLRLRKGEKMKFARTRGGTNPITKQTLSADEVIGEILDNNYSFIPVAIGPFGETGSLFNHFWNGSSTLPLPSFSDDRPNVRRAAERAIDLKTPWDILGRADRNWKREHGDKLFGGSYLSPTPSIWADQQLGLACITHLTNHILSSLSNLRYNPDAKWKGRLNGEVEDDDTCDDDDYYEWKYHVDGGINGHLDEEDEFDSDLMFDVGVRSRIKQGSEEVLV